VIVPSIIIHEVSHGWVALAFGDDTAKRAGRLTLNPIRHVDPFGTIILPLLTAAVGFGAFGYAKPVPVSPRRMRSPRNQAMLTSLAGPAVNIVIAILAALVLRQIRPEGVTVDFDGHLTPEPLAIQIVVWAGILNVVLAVFNLIPLPPLDGSAVIERFLPTRYWRQYLQVRRYSMLILIGVLLLAPQVFNDILGRAVEQWSRLL
jgi:Zn-dependent protease